MKNNLTDPINSVATTSTHVPKSNPYQYDDGGELAGTGTYTVESIDVAGYFSDWGGGSHYVLQMMGDDTAAFAGIIENRQLHLTEECGNDTIRGRAAVPEPATMVLQCFKEEPEQRLATKAIRQKTGLAERTVSRSLRTLVDARLLQRYGKGAGTRYQLVF